MLSRPLNQDGPKSGSRSNEKDPPTPRTAYLRAPTVAAQSVVRPDAKIQFKTRTKTKLTRKSDPLLCSLESVLKMYQVKPPASIAEYSDALNTCFGLISEPAKELSTTELIEIELMDLEGSDRADTPVNNDEDCIFGDHTYSLRPKVSEVTEAVSVDISDSPSTSVSAEAGQSRLLRSATKSCNSESSPVRKSQRLSAPVVESKSNSDDTQARMEEQSSTGEVSEKNDESDEAVTREPDDVGSDEEDDVDDCAVIPEPMGILMVCPFCNDKFYDPLYLSVHVKFVHATPEEPPNSSSTVAQNCSQQTSSRRLFRRPQRRVLRSPIRRNLVPQSEERTTIKKASSGTVKQNNGVTEDVQPEQEVKMYVCFLCDFETEHETLLSQHIQSRHSADKKPYRCMHCYGVTYGAVVFYMHFRTHLESRLYQCRLCKNRYWQLPSLKAHVCPVRA